MNICIRRTTINYGNCPIVSRFLIIRDVASSAYVIGRYSRKLAIYDIARTALDCPSPGEHLPHLAAHEGRLLKACLPQIANDILVNGSSSVVVFV